MSDESDLTIRSMQRQIEELMGDVQVLKTAMVGSPDGYKKGFAHQLVQAMEKLEEITKRISDGERRVDTIQEKQIRLEGTLQGAKLMTVVFWSLLSAISATLATFIFHK